MTASIELTSGQREILDRRGAANYMGCSLRYLDAHAGTVFPFIRIGRRVFFRRAALDAALAKYERKATKP